MAVRENPAEGMGLAQPLEKNGPANQHVQQDGMRSPPLALEHLGSYGLRLALSGYGERRGCFPQSPAFSTAGSGPEARSRSQSAKSRGTLWCNTIACITLQAIVWKSNNTTVTPHDLRDAYTKEPSGFP